MPSWERHQVESIPTRSGSLARADATDKIVKDAGKRLRPVMVAPDMKADERGLARLKQVGQCEVLSESRNGKVAAWNPLDVKM
jgi:hypothetical protein